MNKIKVNVPRNTAAMLLAITGTGKTKVFRDRRNRRSEDKKRHYLREEW